MQLCSDHDITVGTTMRRFPKPLSPFKEVQCFVYRDWHKDGWDALLKNGALDSYVRQLVGPNYIPRVLKVGQDKETGISAHCGGGKTAIRC